MQYDSRRVYNSGTLIFPAQRSQLQWCWWRLSDVLINGYFELLTRRMVSTEAMSIWLKYMTVLFVWQHFHTCWGFFIWIPVLKPVSWLAQHQICQYLYFGRRSSLSKFANSTNQRMFLKQVDQNPFAYCCHEDKNYAFSCAGLRDRFR